MAAEQRVPTHARIQGCLYNRLHLVSPVTPVKTGVQYEGQLRGLDSSFRLNDSQWGICYPLNWKGLPGEPFPLQRMEVEDQPDFLANNRLKRRILPIFTAENSVGRLRRSAETMPVATSVVLLGISTSFIVSLPFLVRKPGYRLNVWHSLQSMCLSFTCFSWRSKKSFDSSSSWQEVQRGEPFRVSFGV